MHTVRKGAMHMSDIGADHSTRNTAQAGQKYEGGDPYIFISYNHDDATHFEYFSRLVDRFRTDGYRFWYDNNIQGGESWNKSMIDRVMHCHVLIAQLSNRYYESIWCIAELNTTLQESKMLIPLECETITTSANTGYQAAVAANFQTIRGKDFERIFNSERVADCLQSEEARTKRLKEIADIPEEEKPAEPKIVANTPAEAISNEIVERSIDQMFETQAILQKPTTMIKRHFYSRAELAFTPEEISDITRKAVTLLRERQNELRTVLFSFEFTGSRTTYKVALTTVRLVKRLTKNYDFWTYDQNQRLHYFVSDSAPLMRLMHCRAVRNELLLSPVMIAAVKNFSAELDRLIDCLER